MTAEHRILSIPLGMTGSMFLPLYLGFDITGIGNPLFSFATPKTISVFSIVDLYVSITLCKTTLSKPGNGTCPPNRYTSSRADVNASFFRNSGM